MQVAKDTVDADILVNDGIISIFTHATQCRIE